MEKLCPKCRRSYSSADTFCPEDGARLVSNAAEAVVDAAPTAEPDDPLIGRIVDNRYELTQLLGVGGMGRVYLAKHRFLERDVAVKILHRGRVHDPSELVRFNRTAVHAGTIVDDHVAQIYDFGETDDGLVYLAMEYVPGDTITRMIKKEGPFEPQRVARLTRQIAKGLDAAHAQGIIHRDLKPDNIMVMRDRNGHELVKIVDFGIAKALGQSTHDLTHTGAIIGTLLYMSPEQLAGSVLDRRSDLYSLALVVFHMLTAELPFIGSTPEEMIYARFDTAGLRPLAKVRPAVPWSQPIQAALDRALARDVSSRFDTAGQFAVAFGTGLESGVGSSAATPNVRNVATVSRRVATWFQEHRRQTGRVAAVVLVSVLALAVGARAVNAWLARRHGTERVDSLARVTATGETHEARDPRTRAITPSTVLAGRSAKKSVTPNGPNPSAQRAESSSLGTTSDSRGDEHDAALRELARYRQQLHPDSTVPAATARAAIQRLDSLMPQFRDRTDSLFAMLYQAHAYYHLGELENECAMLRRIRSRAAGTRLEDVVKGYFGDGRCPD
jgi:serine/threonine protein kinase